MRDMIVLVADKNMEFAVKGILSRTQSLGVRDITFDVIRHSQHDSGVYRNAHDFLRIYVNKCSYAIVMLDREGCGCNESSSQISNEIQSKLDSAGWSQRSKVIVLDPELEIWVWTNSPHMSNIIGWNNNDLRNWLQSEGYLLPDSHKPQNPKLAFENALRIKKKPRSSSTYKKIAERVGLNRCTDAAFHEFKNTLQNWFSPENRGQTNTP